MSFQGLHIMPENEWDEFYSQLKEPLPVVFRITGYKSQAQELLKIIRTQFFNMIGKFTSSSGLLGTGESTSIMSDTKLSDQLNQSSANKDQSATDSTVSAKGDTTEQEVKKDSDADSKEGLLRENIKPPRCLSWYPDELAWQVDLSRKAVRSEDILNKFHRFLVCETEIGNISRQEAVSMIPPLVLDIRSNSRVLDMCASPGSKTAQLIEYLHKDESSVPEGFVVANDRDNKRCYLMVHQVKRLSSPCCMIVNHDAAFFPKLQSTLDSEKPQALLFDRVLADVPCSGDGTIRKNIDVWKKWTPNTGYGLHGLQSKILKRGLELLEVGGRLVYSTCSMHPAEDEAVVAEILRQSQGSVEMVDVSASLPGLKYAPGLSKWRLMTKKGEWIHSIEDVPLHMKSQITKSMFPPTAEEAERFKLHRCIRVLPHQQDTGGFFIAVLQKIQPLPWSREARLAKGSEGKTSPEEESGNVDDGMGDTPAASETSGAACDPVQPLPENRKRKGMTEEGPQPQKQPFKGYKEDPFLFLQPEDPVWAPVRDFYGLGEDFPVRQLLYRSEQGPKRSLYFVSKALANIVENNRDKVRFVNMGVKTLSRSPSPVVPECDFRLAQECMGSLRDLFAKRRMFITAHDAIVILSQESPFFCKLSPSTQEVIAKTDPGSVVFTFRPSESDSEPNCEVTFCGWRGRTSVRSFVPRFEREHYLRLFGKDLHQINEEVCQQKKAKEEAKTAANNLGNLVDGELSPEVSDDDMSGPAVTGSASVTKDDDEQCFPEESDSVNDEILKEDKDCPGIDGTLTSAIKESSSDQ
ncbi:hypothetical protein C0Q70_18817 [Pomacea canaliculata]|uniref:tRNA (cytosine(34)-C(5))-methyltransferase n=1 Tax=Pomacea canaliculata TaxID=400727 RepID=A0A2T7NHK6_POMCA|nr:hypothetical protein C0Q70_18817 [Pomacea canaliculata]